MGEAERGKKMTKSQLETKLSNARQLADKFEFGSDEWESAMQVVRNLVDEINDKFPAEPWSDREWKKMMCS